MNDTLELEKQFGDTFEALKDMVADESFGSRKPKFESLKEKIYDPEVDEEVTENELELIIKVGRERHMYLDDESKWFDLVQKAEELQEN